MSILIVRSIILISIGVILRVKCNDFLDNYEEIPLPTPQTLGPIPKCGEGIQEGKFKCVPYYNCDPLTNTIVDYPEVDGSNNINPRFEEVDRQCGRHLEVCCQIPDAMSTFTSVGQVPHVNLEFEPKCGLRKDGAINGDVPWMVALFSNSDTKSRPFCGGSLLTPIVVLTAAHCVEKFRPSEIMIRVGEWDLQANEAVPYQEKTVSEIFIHNNYLTNTLYNDVAILILNSSLSKADNVGTICVPKDVEEIDQKDCLVSGWGKTSNDAEDYPSILKKIDVSLITNKECEKSLRESIGKEFILDGSFICALGESGKDACKDDGGGPLVCPDSSQRYFQVGVVSWGVNCGESATPGVYANVSQYRDWIDFKLTELGYKSKPYAS